MGKRIGLGVTVAMTCLAALAWSGCKGDFETNTILPEDAGRTPKEGGGDPVDAGDTCPTTTPIDPASLLWKRPAPPQPGKCQADDVAAMREYLVANPKATNEEFANFVKNRDTTCHDCVFADASGPTWSPAPFQDGKVVTLNIGACYALVSGNEGCGEAVQHAWDCEYQACADCRLPSDLEPCRARSRTGVCKATYDASRADCTGIPTGAEELCGSPFDSIRVQCVTAAADAGKL